MGSARQDVPGTAPVPVTDGTGGADGFGDADRFGDALAHFHAQSHDKDVTQVETLFFGTGPSNGLARAVAGQRRPPLPALAPLRDLDPAGPALGGAWTPGERLLAACVEAVRVRRISPADRYPVHRAYPSPRGLFGADLFLVAPEGGGWCLRVDPQSHALQPCGGGGVPADLEGARLVVAVDRHRYPPEYGRLRPSLARLEAGHLLAALGLTLTRAGLRAATVPDPAHPACAEAAPLLPSGMLPVAAVTLAPPAATGSRPGDAGSPNSTGPTGAPLPSGFTGTAGDSGDSGTKGPSTTSPTDPGDHSDPGTSDTPGTMSISGPTNPTGAPLPSGSGPSKRLTLPPEATAHIVTTVAPAGRSLRRWLDERTSGVSTANLVTSAYVSPHDGSTVTAGLVRALRAVHDTLPHPRALRLYRHVLEDDRVDDRAVRELFPDGTEGPALPVPRTGETNFSATLGYTLAVDFPAWARALGPDHAETSLHVLLGWIAQWGCLGAAATDLCARPMRNYSESDWAGALGLHPDQTPAYQLWVRAERGTYMDTPVDAAPETP
ncbi:hypothetical protein ABZ635_11495 [Nocardiopsis sp. NPDC007018]|uniref:hypothetical protein n=1 Tax=Nocardiopsis sp. NPDC007018 TaxID=3155721 RepID=UPI0033FE1489